MISDSTNQIHVNCYCYPVSVFLSGEYNALAPFRSKIRQQPKQQSYLAVALSINRPMQIISKGIMYNIMCPKWDFNQRPSGKWLKTLMTKWTIIMPSKLKKNC